MTTGGFGGQATVADLTRVVPPAPRDRRRRAQGGAARVVIFTICGIYFVGPLIAAIAFTVQSPSGGINFDAYKQIFTTPATGQVSFTEALVYSLVLSVATIVISLGLMIPTQLLLHLRLPRWRGLVEVITLLPLVFPPVVLVVGVSDVYEWASPDSGAGSGIVFKTLQYIRDDSHPLLLALLYTILAMPFVYRSIDAGIGAIDVTTLVEAAQNLGARWPSVLIRVLLPGLRTAVLNAGFLCFALVMGEFTIASILLYTKPFPVWLADLPTSSGQVQAAVSVFSLLLVQAMLLLVGALNWRSSARRVS
jgi:putative spermidine/putrescine transport system permease protein